MEKKEYFNRRDATHEKLMRSVLKSISDTPLVLKGGTALLFGYRLDRFSEDLDFDSDRKLNLESKIKRCVPFGIKLDGIDTLKDTGALTRYRVRYHSEHGPRSLKLEISYRTPPASSDIRNIMGCRVSSLQRIIDQKLKASFDGEDPRSKVRDLYDLCFVARRWPAIFTDQLSSRLSLFAKNPEALVQRYQADYNEDDLIPDLADLEELAVDIHCRAEDIKHSLLDVSKRIEAIRTLQGFDEAMKVFLLYSKDAILEQKSINGFAREVDWMNVENKTLIACLKNDDLKPDHVARILCDNSPGATAKIRHDEIYKMANNIKEDRMRDKTRHRPS